MRRQFATIRDATGEDDAPHEDTMAARRRAYKNRMVRGELVMLDKACPHDPGNAVTMMQIATETGLQVRVALTPAYVHALLAFVRTDGRKR